MTKQYKESGEWYDEGTGPYPTLRISTPGVYCRWRDKPAEPRPHAEMATKYMADITLKCWHKLDKSDWYEITHPTWHDKAEYHVGHELPVKMCSLGGLEFPAPVATPVEGEEYWIVGISCVFRHTWNNRSSRFFGAHETEEAAQAHYGALIAANEQAIKEAR